MDPLPECITMTLEECWKDSILDSITNSIQEGMSVEDIYNGIVEDHKHYEVAFIDVEQLTPAQLQELLGALDETELYNNTDNREEVIERLLFRYGDIMLGEEEEWVCEQIQEQLDEMD